MATNTLDPQIAASIARDLAKYGPRDRLRADNLAEIRADFMRRRLERGMSGGPAMRETREEEEHGVALRRWLGVRPGQAVCDLGCGNGYHALPRGHAPTCAITSGAM